VTDDTIEKPAPATWEDWRKGDPPPVGYVLPQPKSTPYDKEIKAELAEIVERFWPRGAEGELILAGAAPEEKLIAKKREVRKSRTLPTKAGIKRCIAAAQEAGLRVIGILPDGTVSTDKSQIIVEREREVVL
jgi:hypothetical protein